MEIRRLRALMKAKKLSQSEVARRVGVSRQAVSLWLRQEGVVNIHGRHLLAVSRVLGISAEELTRPLPCFGTEHDRLRAELLWDHLYPDLDDFAIAVNEGDPRAIARLVEVHGMYAAANIAGDSVWLRFPDYRRYLHPGRRPTLEALHQWHQRNQTAA